MTDQPELTETSWTETTHRQYDTDGQLISETVTIITQHKRADDDPPTGMYL